MDDEPYDDDGVDGVEQARTHCGAPGARLARCRHFGRFRVCANC
jgi:hypothetical protein